jgi:hypothetical protein
VTESIEVRGLNELIDKMKAYPAELKKTLAITVTTALTVLWENVPPYPPPHEGSTYERTGTLGRSLGSSAGGGASGGEPDVFKVKALGSGFEGRFGSNVDYAPYVIGDGTQNRYLYQWWTLKTIAEKSKGKIDRLFVTLGEKMAAFLEGKG